MNTSGSFHFLLLLIRLALGWYLMLAGWGKVQGELNGGFGTFYMSDSYQSRSPAWLPGFIAVGYGYVLPWAETAFGALMMLGWFNRIATAGSAAVFASIMLALFGAGDLLPRHHIMVFLPVALLLFVVGPGRHSLDAALRRR